MPADPGSRGRGDRRRLSTVAAGVLLALVLAGCVTGAGTTSAPTGVATPPSVATGTTTVEVQGRPFTLYTPPGARPGAALVLVLHGYTGDAQGMLTYVGLRPLADARGFLIAAPQGTKDTEGNTFWNASRACCDFHASGIDDAAYLSAVISTLERDAGVDPSRVFVVGHSNGGFMAYRLACEHADQVAAVASIAGAMDVGADCAPTRAVNVLQVHGDADETIHVDGGTIEGHEYTSAQQTVTRWRTLDGCKGAAARAEPGVDADASTPGDDLSTTTWAGCNAGAAVALWRIAGAGHVPELTPAFSTALLEWLEAHARKA